MLEYVEAQNAIADCFYFGQGVPRNYRKAVYWYRQATKQNHPYATESLANCYYRGEGVVQNFEEAMKYFEKAAQMDSIWALYYLGECYYYGRGVAKDEAKAVSYYQKRLRLAIRLQHLHLVIVLHMVKESRKILKKL